jgi:DMSO/TMAO reductase YedYZ heme-binding membrane subunit
MHRSLYGGVFVFFGAVAATALTGPGKHMLAALLGPLEYVAGVFALLALTEMVVSGIAAAERVLPVPVRLVAQSAHRATTLIGAGFLATHVVLKIVEGHAAVLDAFVPFAGHSGVYVGLGTIAVDLMVLVLITGLMRTRFAASRWPWMWRTMHVLAYVIWPLAIVHGLLAGRPAKPWVIVSYVICGVLVMAAVVSRIPRAVREWRAVPPQPLVQHTHVAGEGR